MQNENLYSVLECDSSATSEELKYKYQQLIKKYHPDKQGNEDNATNEAFLKIDKAWKILRDPESRKQYDASQCQDDFAEHSLIYAYLSDDDLSFDENNVAYYPCRCGNNFVIEKCDLVKNKLIIECEECTNCICVNTK